MFKAKPEPDLLQHMFSDPGSSGARHAPPPKPAPKPQPEADAVPFGVTGVGISIRTVDAQEDFPAPPSPMRVRWGRLLGWRVGGVVIVTYCLVTRASRRKSMHPND